MRVEDAIRLEERGELPEFVLFWGGWKLHRGVSKGCFRNSSRPDKSRYIVPL